MKFSLRSILFITLVIALSIAYWQARTRYYRTHVFLSVLDEEGVQLSSWMMRYAIITETTPIDLEFTPWTQVQPGTECVVEIPEFCRLELETNVLSQSHNGNPEENSFVLTPDSSHRLTVRMKPPWKRIATRHESKDLKVAPNEMLFRSSPTVSHPILGKILDEEGRPITHFMMACSFKYPNWKTVYSDWTEIENENGEFWLAKSQRGTVWIEAADRVRQTFQWDGYRGSQFENQREYQDVEIVLGPGTAIEGVVDGRPDEIKNVRVSIVPPEVPLDDPMRAESVSVQPDGRFRSAPKSDGGYIVYVGYRDQTILAKPVVVSSTSNGEPLRIANVKIPSTGSLKAITRLPPFSPLRIGSSAQGFERTIRTNHRGEIDLKGLVTGVHCVTQIPEPEENSHGLSARPAVVTYFSIESGKCLEADFRTDTRVLSVVSSGSEIPRFRFGRLGRFVDTVFSDRNGESCLTAPYHGTRKGEFDFFVRGNSAFDDQALIRSISVKEIKIHSTWMRLNVRESLIEDLKQKPTELQPRLGFHVTDARSERVHCESYVPLLQAQKRLWTTFRLHEGETCYLRSPELGWTVSELSSEVNHGFELGTIELKAGATIELKIPLNAFDVLATDAKWVHESGATLFGVGDDHFSRSTDFKTEDNISGTELSCAIPHLWPGKWHVVVSGRKPNGESIDLWEREFQVEGTETIQLTP